MTQEETIEMAIHAGYNPYEFTTLTTLKRFAKLVAAKEKEALAQTQEPLCMKMNGCKTKCEDCPDKPLQRTWVGLTIEEIASCCRESTTTQLSFYNAIEAKLKEKNT